MSCSTVVPLGACAQAELQRQELYLLAVLEDTVTPTGEHRCLRYDDTVGHGDTVGHSGAGDMMISIKDMVMLKFTETCWKICRLEDMIIFGIE